MKTSIKFLTEKYRYIFGQFIRFIIIGLVSTVFNYSAFYLLYKILGVNYSFSYVAGFLCGTLLGYGLNKAWTFKTEGNTINMVIRYIVVYLISLGLGFVFLRFLVERVHIIPSIANVFTIGLTTMTNFTGVKLWVFKK